VRYFRFMMPVKTTALCLALLTCNAVSNAIAADKLVALYSSHAVPYSMPWIAEELGLFKKYDLDFGFVYIPSSSTATAAILGNNVEVGLLGGVGIAFGAASAAFSNVVLKAKRIELAPSMLAATHSNGTTRSSNLCTGNRSRNRRRSVSLPCNDVRRRMTSATRRISESSRTPPSPRVSQIANKRLTPSGVGSAAMAAPFGAARGRAIPLPPTRPRRRRELRSTGVWPFRP